MLKLIVNQIDTFVFLLIMIFLVDGFLINDPFIANFFIGHINLSS
jgi:hypothetical protein